MKPSDTWEAPIVSVADLTSALHWVTSLGYVRAISRGPHSVGTTLEKLLGHKLDSIPFRDFPGCELKAQRKETSSNISLFTKTPNWGDGWSARRVLQEFGYEDDKGHRQALRINLYPHEFHGMNLIPTSEGIAVVVSSTQEVIGTWKTEVFASKFKVKVDNIVYVLADVEVRDGWEYFHYNHAEHCLLKRDLDAFDIFQDIQERNLALEWRMYICEDHQHCLDEGRKAGMVRDHGPAVRCRREKLRAIYSMSKLL